MPHKPDPPPTDPEQLKRFKKMAREVEVDESEGAMDRAFNKVIKSPPPGKPKGKQPKPR